jgi:hypothetical protein
MNIGEVLDIPEGNLTIGAVAVTICLMLPILGST